MSSASLSHYSSNDEVYERLTGRGYTDAECESEVGDSGDSSHKPWLSKAMLDRELDNMHYRMVCIRASRAGRTGHKSSTTYGFGVHNDPMCCDPAYQLDLTAYLRRKEKERKIKYNM